MVRSIWAPLLAERAETSASVLAITNGVHTPSWLGPEMGDLLGRHLGRRFFERLLDPDFPDAVRAIPDAEVWSAHRAQKERLVTFARERVRQQFARHGRSPDALREVQGGRKIAEVCRELGVTEQTYHRWKRKYAGMGVTELRRLKQLEDENASLRKLVADLSLDQHILQEIVSKKL